MRIRPARAALLVLLLAATWWLQAEWLFVKRYGSYLLRGYDAHTVPVEWFEPLVPLVHGDGWVPAPGARFDDNNNENNLLGLVLERATGVPYQDYLGRRLWRPAGRHLARLRLPALADDTARRRDLARATGQRAGLVGVGAIRR